MPVYNAERYLSVSVQSILNQTWTDFELITINDCSTDTSPQILAQLAKQDNRIRLLHNSSNLGVTRSLNIGIDQAQGDFIARMDADDESSPTRIEKQLSFLLEHTDIGIVGGGCKIIDSESRYCSDWMKPVSDLAIRWEMLLDNPFIHPTVMCRSRILHDRHLRFNEELSVSQDYDFWTRLLQYTRGANLPEPVLFYRIHRDQISRGYRDIQKDLHAMISQRVIRDTLSMDISLEQVKNMCSLLIYRDDNLEENEVLEAARIYLDMWRNFRGLYSTEKGIKEIGHQPILKVLDNIEKKVVVNKEIFSHPEMKRISYLPFLVSWKIRRTSLYKKIRKIKSRKG